MVILDNGIEDGGKDSVGLLIASIQTNTRVLVVDAGLDRTINCESIGGDL